MTTREGKCLCGAVTFKAEGVGDGVTICHCSMCRRWTGGPFVSVDIKTVTWSGEDHIKTFTSSAWAERGFCETCGTNLFYRVTAEGKHQGVTALLAGSLEDHAGLSIKHEIFIDRKPDFYALAGDHDRRTEAEVMAEFGA